MTAATTLLLYALSMLPPQAETVLAAAVWGTDPFVALAIAECETGNVPEAERDTIVSPTGDVGRNQINRRTWTHRLGYRSREEFTLAMQDRHRNILTSTRIQRRVQDKYAAPDGTCRCGKHAGSWAAHYNKGVKVPAGSDGEAYGLRVAAKVRRLKGEGFNGRRW